MEKDYRQKLSDQIWLTRISRVNAEKRLENKESFIQAINIYYSCAAIIFSILSYITCNNYLSLISTFMSICLLVSVTYFNSQKYMQIAKDYKSNYTELQKLEFELLHLDSENIDEIKQIEVNYCNLMNTYNNHITFDYYKTLSTSKDDIKNTKNWKYIKFIYYWGVLWRLIIKASIIILPIILYLSRGFFNI